MLVIFDILVMTTLFSGIAYTLLTEWSRNTPPTIEHSDSNNKTILLLHATAALFIASFIGILLWFLTTILILIL